MHCALLLRITTIGRNETPLLDDVHFSLSNRVSYPHLHTRWCFVLCCCCCLIFHTLNTFSLFLYLGFSVQKNTDTARIHTLTTVTNTNTIFFDSSFFRWWRKEWEKMRMHLGCLDAYCRKISEKQLCKCLKSSEIDRQHSMFICKRFKLNFTFYIRCCNCMPFFIICAPTEFSAYTRISSCTYSPVLYMRSELVNMMFTALTPLVKSTQSAQIHRPLSSFCMFVQ